MNKFVLAAALFSSLLAAPGARAQTETADLKVVAGESVAEFGERVSRLRELGQWSELRRVGRARREAHPAEVFGWNAEARGALLDGDVEGAIAAGEGAPADKMDREARSLQVTARAVGRNYPGRKFEPLEFVESDTASERLKWRRRGLDLLKAKDYDEIERVAAELQKSKQADVMGRPFLQYFFEGLSTFGPPELREDILAQWRAARPASDLARLAQLGSFIDLAWSARGKGFADSITPEMSRNVDREVERGAQVIAELPASAASWPMMFMLLQEWGKVSGQGRPFLDAIYREGNAKFPDYLPLFERRLFVLAPRWYGTRDEILELLRAHAEEIGGVEGDIVYAQGYLFVHDFEGEILHDTVRFWRGIDALRARNPQSNTLRTVQLHYASGDARAGGDYARAKSALSEPNGHIIDQDWFATPEARVKFALNRMRTLSQDDRRRSRK